MPPGWRVGDVLRLTTAQIERQRFTVREEKTGKTRRVWIPGKLQLRILGQAGRCYAFEGRYDWRKHRTRQAVWKDCARCARFFQHSGTVPKGRFRHTAPARSTRWTSTAAPAT